jgi:hypothetical protein
MIKGLKVMRQQRGLDKYTRFGRNDTAYPFILFRHVKGVRIGVDATHPVRRFLYTLDMI